MAWIGCGERKIRRLFWSLRPSSASVPSLFSLFLLSPAPTHLSCNETNVPSLFDRNFAHPFFEEFFARGMNVEDLRFTTF